MDNEANIVKECVQNLPLRMKDYLAKDIWPQKLSLISQTNKINTEQESAIKSEVFLILIGIENYSDLEVNIQKNVVGIGSESIKNIANDIEKNIFYEIKPLLIEMEKANNESEDKVTSENEKNLDKGSVLNEIENPVPTKPIVTNPAGKNIVLDAQHNLPAQEKKILISSAAVPSRGPILNNFKNSFAVPPKIPAVPMPPKISTLTPVTVPTIAIPSVPKIVATPTISTVTPKPIAPPIQPIAQPVQTLKPIQTPPQAPTPPAPTKYTVDPYREPLE
jgi:hypothetical protein